MTTHEPQDTAYKWDLILSEPPRSLEVRRIPCSCGWRGAWCQSTETAIWAFNRHLEIAARAPKRDCGHPFLTVGPCVSCPPEVGESL